MKIIRPASVTDANLASSTVPETAPAAYNAGTTYAINATVSVFTGTAALVYQSLQNSNTGNTPASSPLWWDYIGATYASYDVAVTYAADDIVISPTTHHEYQSLSAGNVGNSLADATKWLDLGSNNRWRMFDLSNTSQTTVPESITVEVDVTGRADSVSLLNIVASTVQIISETLTEGEIYNETYQLVSDSGVNTWFEYFFEPIVRKGDLIVTDLPLNGNPTITVIISEPSGNATVGTLVIGQNRDLGDLVYGARIGIQDYSRKVADDFGNYTIVERAFSKRASFKVAMENEKIDAIAAILAQYRATPVVYVGADQFTSTWVYGFYRDFSIEIEYSTLSYCSLEIEGLT